LLLLLSYLLGLIASAVPMGEIISDTLCHFSHDFGDPNTSEDAGSRSNHKHESDHDTAEVGSEDSVEGYEELSVGDFAREAVVEADWDEDKEVLKVKEVTAPGSGLVLRDTGNDGDILLGIGGVKQSHRSTAPPCHPSNSYEYEHECEKGGCQSESKSGELLHLFLLEVAPHVLYYHEYVHDDEDEVGGEVLTALDSCEGDEGDEHGKHGAQGVEYAVGHVDLEGELVDEYGGQHEYGDDVYDERVAAPCSNHVEVRKGTENAPEDGARIHRFYPQVESKDKSENGDTLVVVRTYNEK